MTTTPETMAIRLMITCTAVKVDKLIPRIMARSPLRSSDATTPARKLLPRAVSSSFGRLKHRHSPDIAKKSVKRCNHLRPLPDRAAYPLDRSGTHIADREYAGH